MTYMQNSPLQRHIQMEDEYALKFKLAMHNSRLCPDTPAAKKADQHAIKEAYEMGYKAAKEEIAENYKKAEALTRIESFISRHGEPIHIVIEKLAKALYEKGFRIE